jgi:hypothetical protein
MYKFIFELIKEPLGLPISPLYEYLLLIVINEIAFHVAWKASPGGSFGSEIHWLVRVPTFLTIWLITYLVIFVLKWFISNWILIVGVILGFIVLIGLIKMLFRNRSTRENKQL